MGKVVEKVKLTSLFEPEKSVEVEAVIDTGATMVVLPKDIVEELGLRKMGEVKVRYANNKETKPIYGVVNIELKGRSAKKLIPNPASPGMPMMEILMETAYNSEHAVRSCSPKPLRASHTRRTLYACPNWR